MSTSGRSVARKVVFIALALGLWATPAFAADEGRQPPRREARLASGRRLESSILFDRNSLEGSLRVGDGPIALATAGALLRFELPAVRLTREPTDLGEVTRLGHGEGGAILEGLADGRVCRVDPATLDLVDPWPSRGPVRLKT